MLVAVEVAMAVAAKVAVAVAVEVAMLVAEVVVVEVEVVTEMWRKRCQGYPQEYKCLRKVEKVEVTESPPKPSQAVTLQIPSHS